MYRWSITFSHRVEIGNVLPVFWAHRLCFGVVVFPACFVGCGVQIRFGPMWIANPLAVCSSVHAGSWILLYFVDCVMFPSRPIGELCVLLAEFFVVLELWTVSIIHSEFGC